MSDRPKQEESNRYSGEIDPEVADLIGIDSDDQSDTSTDDVPEFTDLFEEPGGRQDGDQEEGERDFSVRSFKVPDKFQEQPKPYFADKDFYKKILTGEGEVSKRVHSLLGSFLNSKDPQDRSLYRGRLIPAHWELAGHIAAKIHGNPPLPKLLFLRFAVLLPTILSADQRDMISRIIFENQTREPIYYVDEWLNQVAHGQVSASAVDETKTTQRSAPQKVNALLEKTRGRYEAQLSLIRNRTAEVEEQEELLKEKLQTLSIHDTLPQHNDLKGPYNEGQKSALSEMNNILRRLGTVNRDLERQFTELESIQDQLDDLMEKESQLGEQTVDNRVIVNELNTVRQMAKMCVGRQGNHFPLLMKQYLRGTLSDVGTRENVIKILAEVEYLDPGIFLRTFKMQTNRIVPNIVLIPCYGDQGICWEPFERFNRATSRARLALPMYPKDFSPAVIAALGDLRWQVAKEKAQHYWMEEGLTGWYYQWFTERRMKGDVKDSFIQDYILWITKESEGTQKLDREVRDIFWRYMPFPQDVKDKLKNRGFVYNELYKKDQNRAMSDGY